MITQNSKGQIILPPAYEDNFLSESRPLSGITAKLPELGGLEISSGLIALILLGTLVLSTLLYYRSYIKNYRAPDKSFVRAINKERKLYPDLSLKK